MASNSTMFGSKVVVNSKFNNTSTNSNNNNSNNSNSNNKCEEVCVICKSKDVQVCTGCLMVYYCGAEHQNKDWQNHKPTCLGLNKRNDLMDRAEKSKDMRKKLQSDIFTSGNRLSSNNNSNSGSGIGGGVNTTTTPTINNYQGVPERRSIAVSNVKALQQQLQQQKSSQSAPTTPTSTTTTTTAATPSPPQPSKLITTPTTAKKSPSSQSFINNSSNNKLVSSNDSTPTIQSPSTTNNNSGAGGIKALQQQLQNSLNKPAATTSSSQPSSQPSSSTSSPAPSPPTSTFVSNNNNNIVEQPQQTPTPPQPQRYSVKIPQSIKPTTSSPVTSTYSYNNNNNSTTETTSNNTENESPKSESSEMKNIKNKLSQINFGGPPPSFKKPSQQPNNDGDSNPTPLQQSSSSSDLINNSNLETNNITIVKQQSSDNVITNGNTKESPLKNSVPSYTLPRKRSSGGSNNAFDMSVSTGGTSTAGNGNTGGIPGGRVGFIKEHKKNQSLPDCLVDYYQSSKNTSNGYESLIDNDTNQKQSSSKSRVYGSFDEEEDEDDSDNEDSSHHNDDEEDNSNENSKFKGRVRPSGLRTNNSAVFEWESGTIEYGSNSTNHQKKLGIGVGSRSKESLHNNNSKHHDDDHHTITNSNSSDDLHAAQQPQQQLSTGGKIAGKFRMIGGDIKKKAGIVGTLTKNKVSEVTSKSKSSSSTTPPPPTTTSTTTTNVNNNNTTTTTTTTTIEECNNSNNNIDYIIFGIPLEESLKKSATLHPLIPDIVYNCIEYIRAKGITEEGIFRLSGSANAISQLKNEFDRGIPVDLYQQLDQHVVAGILKLYLRQIPETLFTQSFGDELETLRFGGNSSDAISNRIAGCITLLQQLPESNRCCLHHLVSLLNAISFEPTTKMNNVNLAIVFAPTLGCSVEVMTCLITYYDHIFGVQTYNYNS